MPPGTNSATFLALNGANFCYVSGVRAAPIYKKVKRHAGPRSRLGGPISVREMFVKFFRKACKQGRAGKASCLPQGGEAAVEDGTKQAKAWQGGGQGGSGVGCPISVRELGLGGGFPKTGPKI